MAVKDFTTSENNDSTKDEKLTSAQAGVNKEINKPASTEVKNASATGDGSFGRSDELPDNEEEMKDNTY